jgi:hypothetical protein
MKKTIVFILLFPLLAIAQPEQYYVTFLKGQVILQQTKQPIKIGDKLSAADQLIFKDNQSKLGCVSPGKGRFELSAQQVKPNQQGELLAVLKSNLLPATNTYHLSTRSLLFEGYDPKTYFTSPETEGRVLVFSDRPLPIIGSYKTDADHFFFIQYSSNGKTIVKKIPAGEKGLQFTAAVFSDENGNMPAQKVMICYQAKDAGKASSSVLASFIPVVTDSGTLAAQLDVIKKHSNITDRKKLQAELSDHIFANFGKIGPEEIQSFIQ